MVTWSWKLKLGTYGNPKLKIKIRYVCFISHVHIINLFSLRWKEKVKSGPFLGFSANDIKKTVMPTDLSTTKIRLW